MQMAIHTFIPLIGGRFRVSYRVVVPFTCASNMEQYFVMCSKIGRFGLLIKSLKRVSILQLCRLPMMLNLQFRSKRCRLKIVTIEK